MRHPRDDQPALITDAPESRDDEFDHRRKRYAIMMALRAVCVIAAAVTKYGGLALNLGIAGDQLDMIEGALQGTEDVDLLLTLGGSQRGDFDLVDDLLGRPRRAVGVGDARLAKRHRDAA